MILLVYGARSKYRQHTGPFSYPNGGEREENTAGGEEEKGVPPSLLPPDLAYPCILTLAYGRLAEPPSQILASIGSLLPRDPL
jgi:hypothetical protein